MRDRLYRSRRDRVIGGLAGGLARNLGVDVTWVRLAWVVLAFATQGVAILVYLVLLFVIPEAPEGLEETMPAGSADAPTGNVDPASPTAPMGVATTRSGASQPPAASPLERMLGSGRSGDGSRTAALIVGVVLVAAGGWLLLRRYVLIDFDLGWPVIAIVLGVILVLAALRTGGRRI
jgi:phage shock protein PspC (stress-responsive transcriptional regulator)